MAASNTVGAVMVIGGVIIAYEALKLIRGAGTTAAGANAGGPLTGERAPFGAGTQTGQVVQQVLLEAGAPADWLDGIMQVIARENASQDPNATNPVSVGGEHATGPAQFLPSTFRRTRSAHGLGPGDIHNQHDALLTMVYYIRDRYGSPGRIPCLYQACYQGY